MRRLAAYSLETPHASDDISGEVFNVVEEWLKTKGDVSEDGVSLELPDGRIATVARPRTTTEAGSIASLNITEPVDGGKFQTTIGVASSDSRLVVSISLSAGSDRLAPQWLDVRRPHVVLNILKLPYEWRYKQTTVSCTPVRCHDVGGADEFVDLVWAPERSVPVVAVSSEYGAVLHPGIVEQLASDLAGVALVAELDPRASWRLTEKQGREWSCYGGAIRLYWPGMHSATSPFDHPLWTSRKLLSGVPDTATAAQRTRSLLRRKIFATSAFAVRPDPMFAEIIRASRQEEMAALRAKASEDGDSDFANELLEQVIGLTERLEDREEQIEALTAQVASLEVALQWARGQGDDVEAETETPPATVEEAVLAAMHKFEETLIFGDSVQDGIATISADTVSAEKIFDYIASLNDVTLALRNGSLGTTTVRWLTDRGIVCSGESETIRNSKAAMSARTWPDGIGGFREFELHLKPVDVTSPDRCVRIYFAYDQGRNKTIIGWIGRHPD